MINPTDLKLSHSFEAPVNNDQPGLTCSVCLDVLFGQRRVVVSECNHRYHEECISTWMHYGETCPVCVSTDLLPLRRAAVINGNSSESVACEEDPVQTCKEGNLEKLQVLHSKDPTIVNKSFLSLINGQSWPLIIFAAQEGRINIVEFLIKNGADINATTFKSKLSALHLACSKGGLDMIKFMLNNGAKADNDACGYPPLFNAITNGHMDVVKFMFKDSQGIYSLNDKLAVLHLASTLGQDAVVKYLLDEGFIANKEDFCGRIAFQLACICGYQKIAELLLNEEDIESLTKTLQLVFINKSKNKHIVKMLLTHGAMLDGSICSNIGWSPPLHIAILYDTTMVEYLLEQGAKVDVLNKYGNSALMIAAKTGCKDTIKVLLNNNASIDAENETLASYIIGMKDLDLFKDVFGDIDLANIRFNSAGSFLEIAVRKDDFQLIKYLITEKNMSVNDCFGFPVIIIAINNNSDEVVAYLLKHGADIDTWGENVSFMELIIEKKSLRVIDYLINHGAGINDLSSPRAYKYISMAVRGGGSAVSFSA